MGKLLVGGLFLAAVLLGIRLWCYRRQIACLLEQMRNLKQEDTNYRLFSCCPVGRTEELVGELNRVLQQKRDEMLLLKRENRSYRESITGISHDIRTPLTSAKGYAQMLLDGTVSDESRRMAYLEKICCRIDDTVDMLEQLFEYARAEAGELTFRRERMNVGNLFADTVSAFYDEFVRAGCQPAVELCEEPCYVEADRDKLMRIFGNLLKNALVHGTGEYRIWLVPKGERVEAAVENRTETIEEADMEHIFERFYTSDQSRTRKTTGLGLALVKRYTEGMGGRVNAVLREGIFCITVSFPMLPPDVQHSLQE